MMKKSLKHTAAIMLLVGFIVLALGCAGSSPKDKGNDVVFWDTSLLSNVTRITEDGLSKDWARISPDGTKLIYCESSKTVSKSDVFYQNWSIVLLRNPTVSAKTILVNDFAYAPAWSDNNTNYFYITDEDNNTRLIRSSVTGSGKTYVTRTPIGTYDNRPSVKGGVIVCDTWMGGKRQLVSLRENGTEITFLGDGEQPSWHPTEPKFIFIRNVSNSNALKAIYEMDLASAQVTEIYKDPNNWNCRNPSYSADGRYILFQKGAEVKTTGSTKDNKEVVKIEDKGKWQIFIMNADGSSLTPITSGNVDAYSPSMDANGWVYFVANTGKTEIYRARVNLE